MKNIMSSCADRSRAARRMLPLLLVLALVVVVGVFWQLHSTGFALSNETYCGLTEHQHSEDCYAEVLVCGLEESEGHTHDESCYETQTVLICGLEESEGHTHDESCYDEEGNLICGLEESEGHTHTEACYETQQVLVCGLEESEGHTHTAECYETQLVCGLEEHTHTAACMSDSSADVESAGSWEAIIPTLTGVWSDDVVAIAESQLGYAESTKNFVLAEDGETRMGYTRYGAWAGNQYGAWDAMFVSFCLHYADISTEDFPEATGAYAWSVTLKNQDLYESAEDYVPVPGDLIFFDTDDDGKIDSVGIVTEVNASSGKLTVIEGDYAKNADDTDAVCKVEYEPDDKTIAGYGVLPEQEDASGEEPAETEAAVLTCEGDGYTVTVTYGEDAQLPEGVELVVTEYAQDSETYQARYEEAAALYGWDVEEAGESGEHELRLFNIGLYAEGEEIAPAAEVTVTLTIGEESASGCSVAYFGSDGAENVAAESSYENGAQSVVFSAGSMGDYGLTCAEEAETAVTLTYEGEGYIVTVTYGEDAMLPEGTELSVSEYPSDSDTWQSRYEEAAVLYEWTEDEAYSFRLFNICLTVDGEEVEPAAQVQVVISLLETDELKEYTVTHYGEEETENIEAISDYEEGTQSVSFGTDGFTDYSLSASANPTFTVQYYAYLDVVSTEGDKTLEVIDTSDDGDGDGGNLPENGGTHTTTTMGLKETGTSSLGTLYKVATKSTLTQVYIDAEYQFSEAPDLEHFDKLAKNTGYTLKEIWVLKDGEDETSTDESDWTVYSYSTDISFTNTSSAASETVIYIGDDTVIRLVYKTETTTYTNKANLYDYDISDGKVYSSASTSSSTTTNNGTNTVYAYTYLSGINSASNYSGTGTMLGFGNNNTGSGLGDLTWSSQTLNKYNSNNSDVLGCTFGLVTSLSNGGIQYASGVSAPYLFDDGDAVGKTTYSNQNLTFEKVGDTYTLTAVSGEANVSGLDTLLLFSAYTNKDIFTNSFWPMDTVSSYNSSGHDVAFGSRSLINYRQYFGASTTGENLPQSDDYLDHNSYFGMQYAVEFTLTEEYVGPLNYYFFGDDDMWVFLDGQLICDIGGVHSSVGEYVDLWDYIVKGSSGTHTLSFYYTERGASGSTCYMRFTLPSVTSATTVQNTGSLKVEKEVDSDGATGDETFTFTLGLKNSSGTALTNTYDYVIYDATGAVHETGVVTNESKFTLKDGYYILVHNLPKGTQCTVTEATTGYTTYYTVDSGDLTEGIAGSGTITNGGTLTMKFINSTPDVEKQVQDSDGNWAVENTAETGSYVQFMTTISDVSNVTNLVLHDKLDEGLTDPYVISVTVFDSSDSLDEGTAYGDSDSIYTVTYYTGENVTAGASTTDECSFEIKFTDSFLANLSADDVIVVCYRATLTTGAEIGTGTDVGNENRTQISYGDNSYSDWDTTTTYTFEVNIFKHYDDEGLSGAEFILYKIDEISGAEGGSTTTVTKYAQVDTDYLTGWTSTIGDATTLTSDDDGLISVKGLAPGTYYLKETKAPDGYTLLTDLIEIIVDDDGDITYKVEGANSYTDGDTITVGTTSVSYVVKVENEPGYELPATGGIGISVFGAVGVLLCGGSGILLSRRKRRG